MDTYFNQLEVYQYSTDTTRTLYKAVVTVTFPFTGFNNSWDNYCNWVNSNHQGKTTSEHFWAWINMQKDGFSLPTQSIEMNSEDGGENDIFYSSYSKLQEARSGVRAPQNCIIISQLFTDPIVINE